VWLWLVADLVNDVCAESADAHVTTWIDRLGFWSNFFGNVLALGLFTLHDLLHIWRQSRPSNPRTGDRQRTVDDETPPAHAGVTAVDLIDRLIDWLVG
jgi:hypothetical protein